MDSLETSMYLIGSFDSNENCSSEKFAVVADVEPNPLNIGITEKK